MNAELQRRSIRLIGHDYSAAGGYYLTIVSFRRECLFGGMVAGEMGLNDLGSIVREEWFKTSVLRPYVELRDDEFVVMPNHVHGIIWIFDCCRGAAALRPYNAPTQSVAPCSLGAIVRAFKSAVTYRAKRELNTNNIWQRNYYEHIIRDQADYERVAAYILANPVNWKNDEENPIKG